MYAVIRTGGKQYKVAPGTVVRVEKLNEEAGASIQFNEVLSIHDDQELKVGSPLLANASVSGTIVETRKAKKVIVFKYKRKKQYRVRRGHRQQFTAVKIGEIKA